MNSIEKIKRAFVWAFILGLSIIFVVAFTVPGTSVGHQSVVIGEIDGEAITTGRRSKYVQYYRQIVDDWRERGVEVNEYFENIAREQAFKSVVDQIAVRNFSIKNRYSISEKELIEAVKGSRFVDREGKFRNKEYEQFKRQGSVSDKLSIEKEVKDAILVQRLIYTLFEFTPISTLELEQKLDLNRFKKTFLVGYLDLNNHLEEILDNQEVLNYYSNHITNYEGQQFEEVRAVVESDYINANTFLLIEKLKTRYASKLASKRQDLETDFMAVISALGMDKYQTGLVSYHDTEVLDEHSQSISVLSTSDFVKKVMLLSKGQVSSPMHVGDAIVIVKVLAVSELNHDVTSSFAVEKFKEEIQKNNSELLQYSFRDNLYKNADVKSKL